MKLLASPLRKILLVIFGVAIIPYLALCVLLYVKQTRLMFFPSATITTFPSDLGVPYEDVWLPVSKVPARHIHGWWMPAIGPERGVLLYLHGNASNIGANVAHAKRFHTLGFSVLLIDYEGYGKSEGYFPSEVSVYRDAAVAWAYLTQERQIPPERIVLYGHSMGGAIAIHLALQQPAAAALIVQGSFTSMRDMAYRTTRYDFLPIDLILTQRFDSIARVPRLQMPVLYIHGTIDEEVPADMSAALYAASPEPKQLWMVAQAGHSNVAEVTGSRYLQVIQEFVESQTQLR